MVIQLENVYYHSNPKIDIKTLSEWILGGLLEHKELSIRTPTSELHKIVKAAMILHGFFKDTENRKLYFLPSFEFDTPESKIRPHSVMRFTLEDKK